MRELYIGGYAQGKLDYVRSQKAEKLCVVDCGLLSDAGEKPVTDRGIPVFYHFHLWVRHLIFSGADEEQAEQAFERLLERHPDWIIVSDEVGNGIVPMEQAERAYRECLGRILIEAARRADRVERVMCGLGQRIK